MKPLHAFVLLLANAFAQTPDCTLDISSAKSPFIIDERFKFAKYDENKTGVFTIGGERLFYVVCPKGTHSPLIGENGDHVACKGGTQVLNIRTVNTLDFGEIQCKNSGVSTVTPSGETCSGGEIVEVGLFVFEKTVSKVSVCFDQTKMTPFYAKYDNLFYKYTGQEFDSSDNLYKTWVCGDDADCNWADSGQIYDPTSLDLVYGHQSEIFQTLGIEDPGKTLVKFPLTTNSILFRSQKHDGQEIRAAPFYDYVNVVPVWDLGEGLNSLIFQFMEFAVNDSGKDTFTGALGVLTLPDKEGNPVEVFLDDGKVPVPKWIWIVADSKKEVVFYYNHPNANEGDFTVCSKHVQLSTNIFICEYDNVIDPDMQKFLSNDLK